MMRIARLFTFIVLFLYACHPELVHAQAQNQQPILQRVELSSTVSAGPWVKLIGSGTSQHQITGYVQGSISVGTCELQSSADGVTADVSPLIAAVSCTSNFGPSTLTAGVKNWVRVHAATGITGSGTVTVYYAGYVNVPGGGSGAVSSVSGDGVNIIASPTTGAVIVSMSPYLTFVNSSPSLSAANTGVLKYNSATQTFQTSVNGGAFTSLGAGSVTGSGTTGTIPLWSGTTALGDSIVTQTGTSTITQTSGTLGNDIKAYKLTATAGSVNTANYLIVDYQITSAGTANFAQTGFNVDLLPGYTGVNSTRAARFGNTALGTANALNLGTTSVPSGNGGLNGLSAGTTTGMNYGGAYLGRGGDLNFGVIGRADVAKNSATNIGGFFNGQNTGTSPVLIGMFAGNCSSTPSFVSATILADNCATTNDIIVARDNGSAVFTIADGGAVTATANIKAPSFNAGTNLAISSTAPSVASGFGSGASFATGSIAFAFDLNVGTTAGTTGVITLPTAAHGWTCRLTDITTVTDITSQTAYTTTTASFSTTVGWSDNDHLVGSCIAF